MLEKANNELTDSKRRKDALREGDLYTDINGQNHEYNKIRIGNETINDLEKKQKNQKQDVNIENARRKHVYSHTVQSGVTQTKDFIFSGGLYSFRGAREAAQKIRTDAKIESTGGGGSGHSPAPTIRAPRVVTPTTSHTPASPAGGGHGH